LQFGKPNLPELPIEHFGIMDVGNRLRLEGIDSSRPVIVHQTPPRIRAESIRGDAEWTVVEKITDEEAARMRLLSALKKPSYDVIDHNCEQFAWFVAQDERKSPQLSSYAVAGVVAGAVTLLFLGAVKLMAKPRV